MRAVLHGFHEPMHQPILDRLVKTLGIEYCELTYASFKPVIPVRSVMHYWYDLNWAEYRVDWNRLRPLDEELLSRLSEAEVVFLKMCDRLEQARPLNYQQRKNLFLQHVRYWNHVLLEEKIDVYLGLNVPHETFDFVLYSLCKLHGIPTRIGLQTQVPDTFVFMDDWERSAEAIGRRYQDLLRQNAAPEPAGRFLRDYQKQTQSKKPTPFYMNSKPATAPSLPARLLSVAKVLRADPSLGRRMLTPDFWLQRRQQSEAVRLDQKLQTDYEAACGTPDLERRFIYLALHYQPEMTTSPLGGAYVEQVLMAQLLASTMPDDVHLYIKEHPMQKKLLGRYDGYYDQLRSLPRTTLVSKSFDTFELQARCSALATATGTAGWEALFREKPVLLFGHNFYQYAGGVFPIRSAEDCHKAMRRIFTGGEKPARRDLKVFLKAMEDTTWEGYLTSDYGRVSEVPAEQNAENLFRALSEALRVEPHNLSASLGKTQI